MTRPPSVAIVAQAIFAQATLAREPYWLKCVDANSGLSVRPLKVLYSFEMAVSTELDMAIKSGRTIGLSQLVSVRVGRVKRKRLQTHMGTAVGHIRVRWETGNESCRIQRPGDTTAAGQL